MAEVEEFPIFCTLVQLASRKIGPNLFFPNLRVKKNNEIRP